MATWVLLTRTGGTVQAIALRNEVQRGAELTAGDVKVVEVLQGTSVPFVPGDRIDEVVGTVAQVELEAEGLLGPDDYGPELSVPEGKTVVTVIPTQRPVRGLHAGDRVRLVFAGTAQSEIPDPLQAWDATVVRTGTIGGSSGDEFCVEVEVTADEADVVAAASASGRLTMTLVTGA
ncbi:MAG: hypothetical protein LBU50_07090 [Cellulomonas sp.]|nr:hypothetical protein [Cellulomonas sp.]